jgi:hypothetical protein
MDVLIELLIRGIAGMFATKPPARPTPTAAPRFPTPDPGNYLPPSISAGDRLRAMTARPPSAPRRTVPPPISGAPRRRPASRTPVMVAEPILTDVYNPGPVATAASQQKPTAKSVTAVKSAPVAATVRSWLKPASLKKQYILTELLQPPVSMREPK